LQDEVDHDAVSQHLHHTPPDDLPVDDEVAMQDKNVPVELDTDGAM